MIEYYHSRWYHVGSHGRQVAAEVILAGQRDTPGHLVADSIPF